MLQNSTPKKRKKRKQADIICAHCDWQLYPGEDWWKKCATCGLITCLICFEHGYSCACKK